MKDNLFFPMLIAVFTLIIGLPFTNLSFRIYANHKSRYIISMYLHYRSRFLSKVIFNNITTSSALEDLITNNHDINRNQGEKAVIWYNIRAKDMIHWIDGAIFDFMKLCYRNGFDIKVFVNNAVIAEQYREAITHNTLKRVKKYFNDTPFEIVVLSKHFANEKNAMVFFDNLYGNIIPQDDPDQPARIIHLDQVNRAMSVIGAFAYQKHSNLKTFVITVQSKPGDSGIDILKKKLEGERFVFLVNKRYIQNTTNKCDLALISNENNLRRGMEALTEDDLDLFLILYMSSYDFNPDKYSNKVDRISAIIQGLKGDYRWDLLINE